MLFYYQIFSIAFTHLNINLKWLRGKLECIE